MCRAAKQTEEGGKRFLHQAAYGAHGAAHGGCHRLNHGDEQPPDGVIIGKESAKRADQHKAAHAPVPGDKEEHTGEHRADDEKEKVPDGDQKQPEKIAPAAGRAHIDEEKHAQKAHDVVEHAVKHAERE